MKIENEEKVFKAYEQGDKNTKLALEDIFGKEVFQVKSNAHIELFLEACKAQKLDPNEVLRYPNPVDRQQEHKNAIDALEVIISYKNKGKIFDYKNGNEYKWFPRFDMNPSDGSGFAFSFAITSYDNTIAYVGPRLSYISEKLCIETVAICMPYYKAMLTQ